MGEGPRDIATADFNNHGDIDLTVCNWSNGTISVLMGTGQGEFLTSVTIGVGAEPASITVGDLNNDGNDDIVVASNYAVNVVFGNGNGTFAAPVNYQIPYTDNLSVTIGDYTNDGFLDIANTNFDLNSVTVLINNGQEAFAQVDSFAVSPEPAQLTTADFNGDG